MISTLTDVLSCLKVWCNTALVGSVLGARLRSSLFELFLELTSLPHGPIVKGIGPLDAQMGYVEALLKLSLQGLDTNLSIRVIQSIGNFHIIILLLFFYDNHLSVFFSCSNLLVLSDCSLFMQI